MSATKNFLYMMQDNSEAKGDGFTGTRGAEAFNSAIEMAKVCGATTALMGIGQQSQSRAQLLIFNERAKKRIKILSIPNILLNYINGYGPLILKNEYSLIRMQSKVFQLGYSLHNNSDNYNGDQYFYPLATALLHNIKLRYLLT